MSKTQTPTLEALRELREFVRLHAPEHAGQSNTENLSVRREWINHLATIDALIAAHPDTKGDE